MSVKLTMEAVNKTVTTEMEVFIVAVNQDISSVTITWIVMVRQNNIFTYTCKHHSLSLQMYTIHVEVYSYLLHTCTYLSFRY